MLVGFFANDLALGMGPKFEIMHGQTIMIIHNGYQMGCAHQGHPVLHRVKRGNLSGIGPGNRFKPLGISRVVGFHGNRAVSCHNRLDFFIGKYGPDTAPARLFIPDDFTPGIHQEKFKHPKQVCSAPGPVVTTDTFPGFFRQNSASTPLTIHRHLRAGCLPGTA